MADILPFKRPTPAQKHKGKSLCRHGHHKWQVCKEKQFDVRQGRLVTVYRCGRCGAEKVIAR
jgi:predicted SprT family Zn-dependent metalloprotease